MSKLNMTYWLSGTLSSQPSQPFSGFSKRTITLDVGNNVVSSIKSIPNITATLILDPSENVGEQIDLLVFIPTVAGVLSWSAVSSTADNCGVQLRANFPFILSNPNIFPYDSTPDSNSFLDTVTASTTLPSLFYFYQATGSTAKITVLGFGSAAS